MLSIKDIKNILSSFVSRNITTGRIIFGIRRTKLLTTLVHWIQDFYRVSSQPSITGLSQLTFKMQLEIALARAIVRKIVKNNVSTSADAANSGLLKLEKEQKQWEEKFINYTRSHISANGVPLSYVIRKNKDPDMDIEYPDFINKTI